MRRWKRFKKIVATILVFVFSIIVGAIIDGIGCQMGIHCGGIFSALIMFVYILILYS